MGLLALAEGQEKGSAVCALASAIYKWLQGPAGGVGKSSGIERLTDVPEFRRVRRRRKSFA
jgi:hypothetical protein